MQNPLSEYEQRVMFEISVGCQLPEAAKEVGVTLAAVKMVMLRVRKKLNADTTCRALSIMFRNGWLT
jgi:DNA-binding NarL/FixJ family response regulator